MSETIRVKVTIDTDELREWAGKHANAGNHGVAHVLYKAADDGESLSEQAIREAKAEERERIARAIEAQDANDAYGNACIAHAARIARETP